MKQLYIACYFLIGLLNVSNIFADFGDTCSPLIEGPSDGYLNSYTAYGHIKGNIDITEYVKEPCNNNLNNGITFCFKMPKASHTPCSSEVTLLITDQPKPLSDLTNGTGSIIDVDGDIILRDIKLSAVLKENNICLQMPTSRGPISLGCKTIQSLVPPPEPKPKPKICTNVGSSCSLGPGKSRSIFNFSGRTIDCLQESLELVFFSKTQPDCVPPTPAIASMLDQSLLTPFPLFQYHLRTTVRAVLILYVMLWAVKIMLNPGAMSANEGTTTLTKMLLVIYFATGFGTNFDPKGNPTTEGNGMLKWVVPILPDLTAGFASIVLNAAGSGTLCHFDTKKYNIKDQFYSLFDAMDCRLGYYLGMGIMSTGKSELSSNDGATLTSLLNGPKQKVRLKDDPKPPYKPAILDNPLALRFCKVMYAMLFGGQVIVFIVGLIYAVVFSSLMIGFLSNYVVSLVTIYSMIYISPVFIPMVLFKRTKSYYSSWLKIVVSCILQPAVKVGFVALLVTIYDDTLYKTCEFKAEDHDEGDIKFTTFDLTLPQAQIDIDACKSSVGYQLIDFYNGVGWEVKDFLFFTFDMIVSKAILLEEFIFIGVVTYMVYFFSQSVNKLAADITSGPNMDAVAISPAKIIDAVKKGAEFAAKAGAAIAKASSGDASGVADLGKDAAGAVRSGVEGAVDGGSSGDSDGGGKGDSGGGKGDAGGVDDKKSESGGSSSGTT